MLLVIDASVIIKWLFNDPEREANTEQATALMAAVVRGEHSVVQPRHWLIEVAAVLARETPIAPNRIWRCWTPWPFRFARIPPC
jgi:predicted nucleic acid-binding protein